MKPDTWIDEMLKDINSKKKTKNEPNEVKLSESDMNTLADIMIKKMSDSDFDVEKPNNDKPEQKNEDTSNNGETSLD